MYKENFSTLMLKTLKLNYVSQRHNYKLIWHKFRLPVTNNIFTIKISIFIVTIIKKIKFNLRYTKCTVPNQKAESAKQPNTAELVLVYPFVSSMIFVYKCNLNRIFFIDFDYEMWCFYCKYVISYRQSKFLTKIRL